MVTSAFFKCLESIVKLVFSSGKKFHCDAYVAMEARSRGIEELDTLAIMTNELNAFQVRHFFLHIRTHGPRQVARSSVTSEIQFRIVKHRNKMFRVIFQGLSKNCRA